MANVTHDMIDAALNLANLEGVSDEARALILTRLPKALPVFVYGTLRPGDYNHDRFSTDSIRKIRHDATAPGVLYFPGHRAYPGARFDEEGTMAGDLLWYEIESDEILSIFHMEIGAGYSVQKIQATYNGTKTIDAIVFQMERRESRNPRYNHPWEPVPGNDWKCSAAREAQGGRF